MRSESDLNRKIVKSGVAEKKEALEEAKDKGELPIPKYFLEDLLKNKPSEKDYKYIERVLKIGDWMDINIEFDRTHVGYERYGIFTNDEKFRQIENSVRELKENYGRWLIIHPADMSELNILLNKEKIEKILAMKEEVKSQGEDDLKVRLYSFSDKPDPKNLGEGGMTLEIERNGKTKFLNEKETEIFMRELKKRTLATLYLEDSMLLRIENGK